MKGAYICVLFVSAIILLSFGIALQYAWKTPVMGYVMVSTGLDFSGSVLLVTAVAELIALILERPRKVKPYENAGDEAWNDSDFINAAHHIDTMHLAAQLQGVARGWPREGLLQADSGRLTEVLQGLPAVEAARRLQACGPNMVTDSSTLGATVVHVVLDVLRRPQTRLLIVAAAVYAFVGVVDELAYLMAVPVLVVLLEGFFIPYMLRRRHRMVKQVLSKERLPVHPTPTATGSDTPTPAAVTSAEARPRSRRASSMVFMGLAAVSELFFSADGGDHEDGHGHRGSGGQAIELLHNEASYTVMRDGAKVTVQATDIVPGDVLILKRDQEVPCDARILLASSRHGITAVEAGLTGQHQPVNKRPVATLPTDCPLRARASMLYRGSVITSGRCACLVVSTGNATHIGRVHAHWHEHGRGQNESKEHTRPLGEHASVSPVTEFLNHEAKKLPILVIAVALVCIAIGMGLGQEWLATLSLALTVCFATIPEELPLLVTGILTVGASMLSSKGVLVRELHSLEAFALIDTIVIAHPPSETGDVPAPSMVVDSKGNKVQVLHTRHQTDSIALLSLKVAAQEEMSASLSTLNSRSMLMTIAGGNMRTMRGTSGAAGRSLASIGRLMGSQQVPGTIGKMSAPKSPKSPGSSLGMLSFEKGTIGKKGGHRAVPWLALPTNGAGDAGTSEAVPNSPQNTVSSAPATQTKGSASSSTTGDTLRSMLVTINQPLAQPMDTQQLAVGADKAQGAAGLGLPLNAEAVVARIPSWSQPGQTGRPVSGRAGLTRQTSGLTRPGLPSIWATAGASSPPSTAQSEGAPAMTASVPAPVVGSAPAPPAPQASASSASGAASLIGEKPVVQSPSPDATVVVETASNVPAPPAVDVAADLIPAQAAAVTGTEPETDSSSSRTSQAAESNAGQQEAEEDAKPVVGTPAEEVAAADAVPAADPTRSCSPAEDHGVTEEEKATGAAVEVEVDASEAAKPVIASPATTGTGEAGSSARLLFSSLPSATLSSPQDGSGEELRDKGDTGGAAGDSTTEVAEAHATHQHLDLEPAVVVRRLRAQGHIVLIVGSVLHDLEAMSAADVAVAHVSVGDTIGLGASILLQRTDVDTLMDIRTDAQALYASMQSSVCFYIAAKMGLILLLFIGTLWQGVPLAPTKLILLELVMDLGACSCYVATAERARKAESTANKHGARGTADHHGGSGAAGAGAGASGGAATEDVRVEVTEATSAVSHHLSLLPAPQHGEHGPAFLPRRALWLIPSGALSLAGCILAGMAYALFDTTRTVADKDLLGFQARAMALITWLMGHLTLAYNMRTFVRPVLHLPVPRSPVFIVWTVGIVILAVALAVVPGAIQGSLLSGTSTSTYSGNTGYQTSYSTPINSPALSGVDVVVAAALAVTGTSWIEGAKWAKWALDKSEDQAITRQASVGELQ